MNVFSENLRKNYFKNCILLFWELLWEHVKEKFVNMHPSAVQHFASTSNGQYLDKGALLLSDEPF